MTTQAADAEAGTQKLEFGELRVAIRVSESIPWLLLPRHVQCHWMLNIMICPIPHTAPWFRGAIAKRGRIIPAFDLHHWLTGEIQAGADYFIKLSLGGEALAFVSREPPKIATWSLTTKQLDTPVPELLKPYIGSSYTNDGTQSVEFQAHQWLHQGFDTLMYAPQTEPGVI